ncbi:hypothetical protein A1O7_05114 [Cladophialophora yegresii CBS 114405]|uniref:Uncharacterized protein n=1 Tax=Cladophialophora yegresii CBS 114405 TaxID=1182544 RepID=W9W8V0_9EURO|nr:uncharacterized protein A1O7_05114 [Cladophialophora yegresii CBS 114405]EXJ60961.1 hypothetical protein A1O7_05114 [Cladophialophora yegresii CBS 114405]
MATIDPSQEEAVQLAAPTTTGSGEPNTIHLSSPPSLETIYSQITSYPFHADQEFLSGLAAILGHPDTPATPEELRQNLGLVLQARCFYLSRKLNVDPPIDPGKYLEWAGSQARSSTPHVHHTQEQTARGTHNAAVVSTVSADPLSTQTRGATDAQRPTDEQHPAIPSSPAVSTPPNAEAEPPYPTSFAAIVDLITRNLPIPGIEDIPPTVLEPGTSKVDKTPRRRKPWEKDADTPTTPSMGEEKQQVTSTSAGATRSDERKDEEETAESSDAMKDRGINGTVRSGQDQGVVKMLQPNAVAPSGLLSND